MLRKLFQRNRAPVLSAVLLVLALVGGIIGTLLVGFFATDSAPNGVSGLFYGGGPQQLGIQAVATGAVLAYSFILTWVIAKVLDMTIGLRIHEEDELRGIDLAAHAEDAYLTDEDPVNLGSATSRPRQADATSSKHTTARQCSKHWRAVP